MATTHQMLGRSSCRSCLWPAGQVGDCCLHAVPACAHSHILCRAMRSHELPHVACCAAPAVNDVCDWVDGLGLSQYRKKFMHNVVNGSLLLRLTDQLLRTELGIGPLVRRPLRQLAVCLAGVACEPAAEGMHKSRTRQHAA